MALIKRKVLVIGSGISAYGAILALIKKEKTEIAEINNVLTGIAEFIKSDYESRVQDEDSKNAQLREAESKKDQADKEKGLEATGKKTNDKIGKQSQGIISPVKGVFQRLMDAVTAIGLGIVGNAAFKFSLASK